MALRRNRARLRRSDLLLQIPKAIIRADVIDFAVSIALFG